MALNHVEALVYLLKYLGFVINREKSVIQTIEFLGLTDNSVNMELQLPLQKIKVIQAESRKLLKEQVTLAHALACLLGKMNATARVVPNLLSPSANGTIQRVRGKCAELQFSSEISHGMLRGAKTQMCKWNGKSILKTEKPT